MRAFAQSILRATCVLVVALAVAALAVLAVPKAPAFAAPGQEIRITSFSELLTQALLSRTANTEGVTYVLDLSEANDKVLDLSNEQVEAVISQIGSLTFGSKDNPFRGTFDGNGYTIKGLDYHRDLFVPAPDTGLFAWTDGAVIKNLSMTDAYVGADYRGGVLVGYAHNTRIENVTMTNCTSSVTPANNSVSLITNAGLAGGMVVGEADGCTFYNVEVCGGTVVNNSTAAVSGLGGEGLYLGAIVGVAKASTLEYCRVTPLRTVQPDGSSAYAPTHVSNKYDIAVGAVAGQAIYAGGLAGSLYQNSSAIDCFSTADCYTYGATYVSVGAGNVGYTGGIAARVDDRVVIERCHYAGNLHSKLYNAILVIPIIQYNVYLGGIVQRDDDAGLEIANSYYGPHFSAEPGTNKDIPAIGDRNHDKVYGGASFGAADEAHYRDRSFWEDEGFDFAGATQRVTACLGGAAHVNTWIMDYDLGIPVHGNAVMATFDFPGAGTVEIGPSDVVASSTPQTTADPFSFAVQGFVPDDHSMEFSVSIADPSSQTTPLISDYTNNQGFRFVGWYREPSAKATSTDASHAYFDPIVGNPDKFVSADARYVAENVGPQVSFAAGDLFVAATEAHVRYHDVRGGVVDLAGDPDQNPADDWYAFEQALPEAAAPKADIGYGVRNQARLIGWTTTVNADTNGGYPEISAATLADIVNGGAFYRPGDSVVSPMDLYPVYLDYGSNIITEFEGHDLDGLNDPTMREGVGRTDVTSADGSYTIAVTGVGQDGSLPEGYRFIGWYETDESGREWRVSADPSYTLPADVDLSKRHVYTARFEYRVQAWLPVRLTHVTGSGEYGYKDYFANNGSKLDGLYATVWLPYRATGAEIDASFADPSVRERFFHWTDHANLLREPSYTDDYILSADELNGLSGRAEFPDIAATAFYLTEPSDVDAIVEYKGLRDMITRTDFPGCAEQYRLDLGVAAANRDIHLTAKEGYRYSGVVRFSTAVGNDPDLSSNVHHNSTDLSGRWNGNSYLWNDVGHEPDDDCENIYLLKASADVNFYDIDGAKLFATDSPHDLNTVFHGPAAFADDATATRKYESLLFNPAGVQTTAEEPLTRREDPPIATRTAPVGLGSIEYGFDPAAPGSAPDAMTGDSTGRFIYREGAYYGFLGWVCPEDLSPEELSHAFENAAPTLGTHGYVATSANNAVPYLLAEDARVYHAMEVYPVYAQFEIETTTNIARAGVPAGSGINVPKDPAYQVNSNGADGFAVALTADVSTTVGADSAETYRLTAFKVEREDGSVETLASVPDAGNEFAYSVRPGERYVFVAYYEPLAVSYHVSETDVQVFAKNRGDALGAAPAQSFNLEALDLAANTRVVFAGWTEAKPASGACLIAEADQSVKLVKPSTVVQRTMELFPVFRKIAVSVDSNIDAELAASGVTDLSTVRTIERTSGGSLMLRAATPAGYEFVGWYAGYVSDAEPGSLVSSGDSFALPSSKLFAPATYTAVYRKVFEVRYHDAQGSVAFTARVAEGDARSFVTTEKDDQGNPQTVVLDSEAWRIVSSRLDAAGSLPDAQAHELLHSWQWVQADGTCVAWDDFCRNAISSDMDLYPVTRRVASYDATGKVNSPDLYWALDPLSDVPVKAYFKAPYSQQRLTVNVQKVFYGTPGAPGGARVEPVAGKGVGLHASPLQGDPWVRTTDGAGNAVFEFSAQLKLSKQTTDPEAAGMTFSLEVTEATSGITRAVLLTMPDAPDADGVYRAEATLNVPVGRYRVGEDAAWAWRYEPQFTSSLPASCSLAPAGTIDVDVMAPVSVDCRNVRASDAWDDDSAHIKNVFAAQGGGA